MNVALVIPARFESTRLPGKPLIDLCGVPMIVRTYRQCLKANGFDSIVVATDDIRVQKVCHAHSVPVLMTSQDCLTGTDRVAECALTLAADTYVNVQGDEPVFDPNDVSRLCAAARELPNMVLNGYTALRGENEFRDPSIPKAVIREDGRLLYMSRASIPTTKKHSFVRGWRQVCAYAFPYSALVEFANRRAKTVLEEVEDIEILRFLEIGWDVKMIELSGESHAVDRPEDVIIVTQLIQDRGL